MYIFKIIWKNFQNFTGSGMSLFLLIRPLKAICADRILLMGKGVSMWVKPGTHAWNAQCGFWMAEQSRFCGRYRLHHCQQSYPEAVLLGRFTRNFQRTPQSLSAFESENRCSPCFQWSVTVASVRPFWPHSEGWFASMQGATRGSRDMSAAGHGWRWFRGVRTRYFALEGAR